MISRSEGRVKGHVTVSEHLGSDTYLHVTLEDGNHIVVRAPGEFPVRYGEELYLTGAEGRVYRFDEKGMAL